MEVVALGQKKGVRIDGHRLKTGRKKEREDRERGMPKRSYKR